MIQFSDFSLRRANKLLFSQVNITIHKNQKVGLIGANGCGKSSLLAVLKNELYPDEGNFSLSDKLMVAHVLQETPALAQSALDYVKEGDDEWYQLSLKIIAAEKQQQHDKLGVLYSHLEAIDGYHIETRVAKLLAGLGFKTSQLNDPVSHFSGGWRMRLNLARALICRSDVLLLDEPTNHLDLDTVIWLESWLKSYQGTLLLISHDRDFLDTICTHILHIEQLHIDSYTGNYSYFEKARYEKRVLQQGQHLKQQNEVKQLQQFIDRFRAQATKAKQVQSRIKTLEKMQQIAAVHEQSQFSFHFNAVDKIPNPLLEMKEISAGYGKEIILSDINFKLSPGSRIALLGENGAGKSTLVKILAGLLSPVSGSYFCAENLKIGYFAQHQLEQLDINLSPFEFIQSLDKKATEQSVRNFLGGFAFASSHLDNMADSHISQFSGGEKARLVLAGLVYQNPGLILLDEPTNHLDLEMREALSFALQEFQGAMVVVSHDRHLLNSISDEFYLVSEGKVSAFEGDLDDYRSYLSDLYNNKQKSKSELELQSDVVVNKKELRQQEAEKRRKLQPIKNQIKAIETKIDKLNKVKQTLETQLSDPAIYTAENKNELKDLLLQQGDINKQLDELEEQWLELHDELEQYTD
jgi:ATP-binding cassette, subfamily F, member 3